MLPTAVHYPMLHFTTSLRHRFSSTHQAPLLNYLALRQIIILCLAWTFHILTLKPHWCPLNVGLLPSDTAPYLPPLSTSVHPIQLYAFQVGGSYRPCVLQGHSQSMRSRSCGAKTSSQRFPEKWVRSMSRSTHDFYRHTRIGLHLSMSPCWLI